MTGVTDDAGVNLKCLLVLHDPILMNLEICIVSWCFHGIGAVTTEEGKEKKSDEIGVEDVHDG